ncbi:MAG: S24/S26 family peptidase [Bacteroidales bacterium]|nr:S24/S26 family peptidase [Bacteroidales bacterium]
MQKLVLHNEDFFARVVPLLRSGQKVTIPVKGYSMLPFIRGERDLVELQAATEYVPGDIVLFSVGGRYVMHRLQSVSGGVAEIMGDGVYRGREHCPVEDIYGRAVTILHNGKKPIDPRSEKELRRARTWKKFLPIRRYLIFIYKRLPWNMWLLKQSRNEN